MFQKWTITASATATLLFQLMQEWANLKIIFQIWTKVLNECHRYSAKIVSKIWKLKTEAKASRKDWIEAAVVSSRTLSGLTFARIRGRVFVSMKHAAEICPVQGRATVPSHLLPRPRPGRWLRNFIMLKPEREREREWEKRLRSGQTQHQCDQMME